MREILFRGKRIDNGEWVFGSLLIDGEAHKPASKENISFSKHYIVPETDADNIQTRFNDGAFYLNTIAYHIIPETVGQFTGLTDKNGKKIFEGDIVQGKDRLEKHLEVFGYIDHKNGSFVITGDFMTHYRWLDYDVEVIGNIHDNPELLGGE